MKQGLVPVTWLPFSTKKSHGLSADLMEGNQVMNSYKIVLPAFWNEMQKWEMVLFLPYSFTSKYCGIRIKNVILFMILILCNITLATNPKETSAVCAWNIWFFRLPLMSSHFFYEQGSSYTLHCVETSRY